MKVRIPVFKKLFSRFNPQKIKRYNSDKNEVLDLLYYKHQFILCTNKAIYSDGDTYAPFRIAFENIFKDISMPIKTNFLLLGGGICSANQILYKYNPTARHTVVEYDATIIDIARATLNNELLKHIEFIHQDAFSYLSNNTQTYDIIGVDIFKDISIPQPFLSTEFIILLHKNVHKHSYIIFNWLDTPDIISSNAYDSINKYFSKVQVIPYMKNLIVIAQHPI